MKHVIIFILVVLLLAQTAFAQLPDDVFKQFDTSNKYVIVETVKNSLFTQADLDRIKRDNPNLYSQIDGFGEALFFGVRLLAEEPRYKAANDAAIDQVAQFHLKQGPEFAARFVAFYENPANRSAYHRNTLERFYHGIKDRYLKDNPEMLNNFDELYENTFTFFQAIALHLRVLTMVDSAINN